MSLPRIAVDAMGGDEGVRVMGEGAALARRRHENFSFLLMGDSARIERALTLAARGVALRQCRKGLFRERLRRGRKPEDKPARCSHNGRRDGELAQEIHG